MRKLISLFLLIPTLVYSQNAQLRSVDSTFTLKTFATSSQATMKFVDNIWIWTDTTEFIQALRLKELTVIPGTPESGIGRVYIKDSDSDLYFKNDAGVESSLTAAAAGGGQWTDFGTFLKPSDAADVAIHITDTAENDSIIIAIDGSGNVTYTLTTGNVIWTTGNTGDAAFQLPASSVSSTEILNATILEVDLNVTNAGTDNFVLSFNSAGGNFTWVAAGGAGTDDILGGTGITVTDGANTIAGGDATVEINLAANLNWTNVHTFETNELQIQNANRTFQYLIGGSAILADRVALLPLLLGADTFVFATHTQTLSAKTLLNPTIASNQWTSAQHAHAAANSGGLLVVTGALDGGSITSNFGNIDNGASSISSGSFTAVGSFIIGSADMSEVDLEKLDGITDGAGAANKALVLDASSDIASGLANLTASATITVPTVLAGLIDPAGAVDLDLGSADILDVRIETDGGVVVIDGSITQDAGTTLFMGGLLDATGAVDMDYGSGDITDHTFSTDGTGDSEIVLPTGSIGSGEILDGDVSVEDVQPELDNKTISYSVIDTVKAGDLFRIWEFNFPVTIDSIVANTDAGTATFNLQHRAHLTPRTAGTNILTASLVADAFEVTSSFADATIPAGRPIYHVNSAVSGGADRLDVTIFYKID